MVVLRLGYLSSHALDVNGGSAIDSPEGRSDNETD